MVELPVGWAVLSEPFWRIRLRPRRGVCWRAGTRSRHQRQQKTLTAVRQLLCRKGGQKQPVSPTYVVATLPGSDTPEFLLLTSFVPRLRDNLIGMMLARCDGENLGEIVVLQLSKQQLIFGPMQIAARINQRSTSLMTSSNAVGCV